MKKTTRKTQRKTRHARVRAKVKGTGERPRLSVFRSNKHLYAQLIDDTAGKVLASVSDKTIKQKKAGVALAKLVGAALAKEAAAKKVSRCVFDRGGYKYHGQLQALAQGAREGGLEF